MASNTSVVTSFILITVLKVWISLAKEVGIRNVSYFCPVKFLEISVLHMAFICKQFLSKALGCPRKFCLFLFCFFFIFFLWKFSLPSFMNKEDINKRKCGFGGGRQTERRGLEGSTFTSHTQVRWRTHLRTR